MNNSNLWKQMWASEQQRVATSVIEELIYPEAKERNLSLWKLGVGEAAYVYPKFMRDSEALRREIERLLASVFPSYGDIITFIYSESGEKLMMFSQPPPLGVAHCLAFDR